MANLIIRGDIFDAQTILTENRTDGFLFSWNDIISKFKEPFNTMAWEKIRNDDTMKSSARNYISEYLKIADEDIVSY